MDSKVLLLVLLALIMCSSCVLCSSWILGVGSVYAWRPRNCSACTNTNKRKRKPQPKNKNANHNQAPPPPPPPPPPSVTIPPSSGVTSTTSLQSTTGAITVAAGGPSGSITGTTSTSLIGAQAPKGPANALPAQYETEIRKQLETSNATNTNMDIVAPWNMWQFDGFERLSVASPNKPAFDIRDVAANVSASGADPARFTGVITMSSLGNR